MFLKAGDTISDTACETHSPKEIEQGDNRLERTSTTAKTAKNIDL